jgi:hypothetical protein
MLAAWEPATIKYVVEPWFPSNQVWVPRLSLL